MGRVLSLRRHTAAVDRGELLTPQEVAVRLLKGAVTPAWVRAHCPNKVVLGRRTVLFFEQDIRDWLEARRQEEARRGA